MLIPWKGKTEVPAGQSALRIGLPESRVHSSPTLDTLCGSGMQRWVEAHYDLVNYASSLTPTATCVAASCLAAP